MAESKFLISAGEKFHLLAHSKGVIASSPATATEFPATHLHDSIPSLPSKFSAAQDNSFFDMDLNLKNTEGQIGNMEVWDTSPDRPVGLTLFALTVATEITASPIEGSSTLQLRNAGYFDYDVPTGTRIALAIKMATVSGSATAARLQVVDIYTRDFLQPDGTWTTTETDLWTENSEGTGNARQKGITFTTRPFSIVKRDLTRLRVQLIGGSAGNEGLFDDLVVMVVPNFFSVHGHNVPVKTDSRLMSSANSDLTNTQLVGKTINNVFTLRDAQTLATFNQPSFYYRLRDNCPLFKGSGRLELTSGVVARADSKKITVSLWVRRNGDDSVARQLFVAETAAGSARLQIFLMNTNAIRLVGKNSADTTVIDIHSEAESLPPDTDKHHVVFSVDTTNDGGGLVTRKQVFVDRVSKPGPAAVTVDGIVDFSAIAQIFWNKDQDTHAAVNEVYVQPDFSEDLTVGANLNKFHSAGIGRSDLGSDGSTPSGSPAWLYQYGTQENPITDFAINHGDGGGPFTLIGTVESELMFGSSRFWRFAADLIFTGAGAVFDAPPEAIEYGQTVFAQIDTLNRQRLLPNPSPLRRSHIEQVSRSGDIFRESLSQHDMREFRFTFLNLDTDRDEWEELRDRFGGGTRPIVIVPDTNTADAHFGYMSVTFDEVIQHVGGGTTANRFTVNISFSEMPFTHKL